MPQATESITTSRRGFLVSAAAVVALAPTISSAELLPVQSVTNWKRFEAELVVLCSLIDEVDDDLWFTNRAVAIWEKRNPFPDSTVEQERAWVARYENAVRQSGRGTLNRARNNLYARYNELLQRIADTPALNPADSRAKAQLVRFERNDGPIRKSILRNLLTL